MGKGFHFLPLLCVILISYGVISHGQILESISQLGAQNFRADPPRPRMPRNNDVYDFIVVGGGTAGCVLASRLSENPNWRVALLEAGGTENILTLVPSLAGYQELTTANWNFPTVPQENACRGMYNNVCFHPRGRILGGTSSINYMLFTRGNRRDFDQWSEAGNYGWSYNEVLPYFLKLESAKLNGLEFSPFHNRSGPLSVEYVRYRSPLADAFVQGSQEAGLAETDYNGESQIGVSYAQSATKNGRRHSANQAYIEPIKSSRQNLEIFTHSRVSKLLIDPSTKSAYGVEFIKRNQRFVFKANKEVILSAGVFMSPQLLMLSGIGPEDNLSQIGVDIIQPLPVGVRMYEHASHFGPTFTTNSLVQPFNISDAVAYFAGSAATPLSWLNGVEALAFIKAPFSPLPPDWPDVELIFASGSFASDGGTAQKLGGNIKDEVYDRVYRPLELSGQSHFSVLVMPFHPKSVGRVWLQSADPLQNPKIDPNYFGNSDDMEYFLHGIKEAIRITQTPAMQRLGAKLHDIPVPGCEACEFNTDDYWRCSVRTLTYTLHHQVATCRMGPSTDATAVVSPELKVHGIRKLRVVDGSVIPFPPTAHTSAVIYMIAEKAADMIRGEWEEG